MRKENGFSLIAEIAAIAIPNLIEARMAANDSSAAASMPMRPLRPQAYSTTTTRLTGGPGAHAPDCKVQDLACPTCGHHYDGWKTWGVCDPDPRLNGCMAVPLKSSDKSSDSHRASLTSSINPRGELDGSYYGTTDSSSSIVEHLMLEADTHSGVTNVILRVFSRAPLCAYNFRVGGISGT